jgi:2-keto-3-deoxy-L-rhamnonate aldolase RhmA
MSYFRDFIQENVDINEKRKSKEVEEFITDISNLINRAGKVFGDSPDHDKAIVKLIEVSKLAEKLD